MQTTYIYLTSTTSTFCIVKVEPPTELQLYSKLMDILHQFIEYILSASLTSLLECAHICTCPRENVKKSVLQLKSLSIVPAHRDSWHCQCQEANVQCATSLVATAVESKCVTHIKLHSPQGDHSSWKVMESRGI